MAHMHRPGGIGADVFDIDHAARAQPRAAIVGPKDGNRAQFAQPDFGLKPQVDEARPGHLGTHHLRQRGQQRGLCLGQRARVHAGRLGQHHRGIGGDIAMRGITRRLHRHGAHVEPIGQRAGGDKLVVHPGNRLGEALEDGLGAGAIGAWWGGVHGARVKRFRAKWNISRRGKTQHGQIGSIAGASCARRPARQLLSVWRCT